MDPGALSRGNGTNVRRGAIATSLVTVGLLFAVCVALVFRGGAYGPSTWLPFMVGIGALLLLMAVVGPAFESNPCQRALIAVFILQAAWTAASAFWASSLGNVWEEANRTLMYVVVVALVFASVRWAGTTGLKAVAAAVAAVAVVLAVYILIALNVSGDPLAYFGGGRLKYPVTYFNGLAALLMIGFWLLLGMANGARLARPESGARLTRGSGARPKARGSWARRLVAHDFPRWTQPVLLVLAVVVAEVALLPQSRGAFWTFFMVVPFFFILSPNRFRALINLALIVLPVVLFWGDLHAPYLAIKEHTSLGSALLTHLTVVGYSAAIVLGGWAVTWGIERWIGPLSKRVVTWIGVALACLAILGAAGGVIYGDIRSEEGLDDYIPTQWDRIWSDQNTGDSTQTRLGLIGLSGRLTQWKTAYQAFEDNAVLGIGAQNFEDYWYQYRVKPFSVTQPHSLVMRMLSELGLPGLILWLAFVVGALVYATVVRFRKTDWSRKVLLAAMTVAALSWFIHSSADWLWHLSAVTLPVMLLLGALIGAERRAARREVPALSAEGASAEGAPGDTPAQDTPPYAPTEGTPAGGTAAGAFVDEQQWLAANSPRVWLSVLLRIVLVLLALGVMATAAFPYLSQRYSSMASGADSLQQAEQRADTASWLNPASTAPHTALAVKYQTAAAAAPTASERLDQLLLAVEQWEAVIDLEPASWEPQYQAADTLLDARNAALEAGLPSVMAELVERARAHIEEARRLNPLSEEITPLEEMLL